jgi:hypothetical protein
MSTEVVNYGRAVVRSDCAPINAPVNYAEERRQAPVADPGEFAARRELAHFINKNSDEGGFIDAAIFAAGGGVLSSGFALPAGVRVQASEAFTLLGIAREAGIPQAYITRFFEIAKARQR